MKSNRKFNNVKVDAKNRTRTLEFNTNITFEKVDFNKKLTTEDEDEIFKYIIQRYKEKTFDNFKLELIRDLNDEVTLNADLCENEKEIVSLWEDVEATIQNLIVQSYK